MQYDAQFNGLLCGPTQDITISRMEGLTGSPPVRTNLVARLGSHGSFFGRDLYGERTVTLTLNLWPNRTGSGSTLDSLTQQLEQALVAQQTSSLQLLLNGGTRMLNCRPLNWDMPRSPANAKERWGIATAQFVAADPFLYDAIETVLPLACFASPAGGWTFPWPFPWTFTPATPSSAGTTYAANNGSIETAPWFRIIGPYDVGFELLNLTTGGLLQVDLSMQATDWVDIDMGLESVLFQSASNRRNAVVQGTDFWKLPPGGNTVRLSTLGGVAGGASTMHLRSAYIALRA